MSRQDLKDLAAKIHRGRGDALEGEQIIGQARKIGPHIVVAGTSRHRIQQVVLKVNALCVIDRPFRLTEEVLKLKERKSS